MKKGMTLLEIIIVIVVLAILATIALFNYSSSMEKGRSSEARAILMQIRTAYNNYAMEHRYPPNNLNDLDFSFSEAPDSCEPGHFFSYSFTAVESIATRCVENGKSPDAGSKYVIKLNHANGTWTGL